MPIYEYQCNNCHHQFDLIQKFSDAPITKCPKCALQTVDKLISAAGFQLKGTGWYATDFKNKTPSSGEQAKETTAASKEVSSENKSASSDASSQ